MEPSITEVTTTAVKVELKVDDKVIGRGYIYLIKNDLHEEPYGLLEDVFVDESERGKGYGTKLIELLITKAKEAGCYKLLATSRFEREKVHAMYEKFGFTKHGYEFRLDF